MIFFSLKVLRAQLELAQLKQEIDRKIAEKEEEFGNTRYFFKPQFSMYKLFFIQEEPCKSHGFRAGKSRI